MKQNKKYLNTLNSGEIYDCYDPEMLNDQILFVSKQNEYNATEESEEGWKKRTELLKEMCGSCGENVKILPPFHANWGLRHVHFGKEIFINYNATFVDDADIYISDNCMFGPNVTLVTANHPISPSLRLQKLEYNKPIHIGKNCWLGANVIVLSGVTIGENSVIGAGSVVTRDIPANVVAVGNPCKVIRPITEEDDNYYDHGKEIPSKWKRK